MGENGIGRAGNRDGRRLNEHGKPGRKERRKEEGRK